MAFVIKNKYSFYYSLSIIVLFVFLKLLPNDFILGMFDFFITALPFTIIIAASILAYIRTRHNTNNSPEESERIRKKFFATILQMMVITLLFYILYSPTSFLPYLEAFKRIAKLLSFENYFLVLIYISIFTLAGTLIQIFVKAYLTSQGLHQYDIKKTTKNSLYALFFIFLLIFGSSLAVYPAAYTPITQYVTEAFTTTANQPNQSGVSTLATAFSKSLKNLKNNIAYSNQDAAKNIQEATIILTKNISTATADVKNNLINDIGDKLDATGGTVDGKLTVNKNLTVGGTTNSKDILPQDDGSYDIGSASKGWGNAYISRLHGSSPIIVGDLSSAHSLSASDDFIISGNFEAKNDSYFDGEAYFTRNIDLGANRITNLADPQSATDAANKQYVDNQLGAAAFVQRVGTTLSAVYSGDVWDLTSGLVTINNLSLNGTLTANNIGTHNLGLVSFTNGAITGVTTLNNLTLASASDGFTIAGGTTSRTLTVTGANATVRGTNTGDQTDITGNAGTVTNGLYDNGSYSNPSWLTSLSAGKISGTLGVDHGGTGTTTQFTLGSLAFAGASGVYAQDNANLFWDDTNNRLGIGTTSPVSTLDVRGPILSLASGITGLDIVNTIAPGANVFQQDMSASYGMAFLGAGNDTYSFDQNYIKTRSTDGTNRVAVVGADELGMFHFYGDNAGGGIREGARIAVNVDTTQGLSTGDNFMPGRISFFTTANTVAAMSTERMRINSSGNVGIGVTGPLGRLHARMSGVVTATTYDGYFNNIATNATIDGINKYGMYITSTGNFIGAAGGNYNYNYGLYVDTPTGADLNFAAIFAGGNVGIGTTYPTSSLDIQYTGTAKANADILEITNFGNAADMDGTKGSILFNQYYYNAIVPLAANAGRIGVVANTDWTSTASTQDSYMTFETALDGTVAEKMRIMDTGNIGIGSANPVARLTVKNIDAVTSQVINGFFNNMATNATTDGINKFGMYISSAGTFTGLAGVATNNYGLYVETPSGADNNYAAIFEGG